MGRGFGRGAKSVAIVTHAQVGKAGKKTPKGLRGNRQRKRQRFAKKHDDQQQLEESLGLSAAKKNTPKTLAQQIASISVPHIINKRQKGLKSLRRQIISAVKQVRHNHSEKGRRRAARKA